MTQGAPTRPIVPTRCLQPPALTMFCMPRSVPDRADSHSPWVDAGRRGAGEPRPASIWTAGTEDGCGRNWCSAGQLVVLHWTRSDIETFVVLDVGTTYRYRTGSAGPPDAAGSDDAHGADEAELVDDDDFPTSGSR